MPANNLLQSDFYKVESDFSISPINIDSLTMFIEGREDTLLYDNSKKVGSISIPLSDELSSLKVIIKINDGIDTIYLNYRSYSVFRSTECGIINRYEILDYHYTENKILNIYLQNEDIDETKAVNFIMRVDID